MIHVMHITYTSPSSAWTLVELLDRAKKEATAFFESKYPDNSLELESNTARDVNGDRIYVTITYDTDKDNENGSTAIGGRTIPLPSF